MRVDFVSDIACPWCAIGLASFERALARIEDAATIELRFQPFELNPRMGPEGEDATAYLARKYGIGAEQVAISASRLREQAQAYGLEFAERRRVWNTFDAHRLLYWAFEAGGAQVQRNLERALLRAYHGEGLDPGEHNLLVRLAGEAGLDAEQAQRVLGEGRYAAQVRAAEAHWQALGISAVPSVIVDQRHLIQGAQPPELFEQALRRSMA